VDNTQPIELLKSTQVALEFIDLKKTKNIEITKYIGCQYLMGGNSTYNKFEDLCHKWNKQKNPGLLTDVNIETEIGEEYKQVNLISINGTPGLGFWLLSALKILCIFATVLSWFLKFYYINTHDEDSLFLTFINDYASYTFIGLLFIFSKLRKLCLDEDMDINQCLFNRLDGVVSVFENDDKSDYDFSKFSAVAEPIKDKKGLLKYKLCLLNKDDDCIIYFISSSFIECILTWNYIVQFMDATQPLPDIPIHETTRHLDPTTKSYDEQSGREPNYWANMTRTKAREIHFAESKKAKEWIEERKDLLNKKGTHDHGFLNKLVTQHLV